MPTRDTYEYFASLPDNSREFYIHDIRDMLHRLYPNHSDWVREYVKIYKKPLPFLIRYHQQLLQKLMEL